MNLSPLAVLRSFARSSVNFLFPPLCLSCAALIENEEQRICSRCWNSIEMLTPQHPLFIGTKNKLVRGGMVNDLVSLFVFEKEGAFQHIAHALKYQGFRSVGTDLGLRVGALMNTRNVRADMLIPVPLHRIKLRERGYNQAEMIAKGISGATGIPVRADLVRRKKHTQTQTLLDLEQRKQNMDEAFELSSDGSSAVKNKVCIIVDDVITTGATINSCAVELRNADARMVIASSAALAQKDAT